MIIVCVCQTVVIVKCQSDKFLRARDFLSIFVLLLLLFKHCKYGDLRAQVCESVSEVKSRQRKLLDIIIIIIKRARKTSAHFLAFLSLSFAVAELMNSRARLTESTALISLCQTARARSKVRPVQLLAV